MKKRFLLVAMIIALALCLVFVFVACNNGGESNENSNESGNENGSATIDIATDYSVSQIDRKINEIAGNDGLLVKLHVVAYDSDEGDEDYYVAIGVKEHTYYLLAEDSEMYFVVNDDNYVSYQKVDGVWEKEVNYYGEYVNKSLAEQMLGVQKGIVFAYLGWYANVGQGTGVKTTATVAGRSCDKYTVTVLEQGASFIQEICVDKATGICLSYSSQVAGVDEKVGAEITCTEFNVSYSPTLPTVDKAHTTINGEPDNQGGNNEQGGNTEQGGNGEQGGTGEQVKDGPTQPGESDQAYVFVNKHLTVSSVDTQDDAVASMFSGAYANLYVDATFELVADEKNKVLFGNFTFTVDEDVITLTTTKVYFDGEYSFEVPESLSNFVMTYDEGAYELPLVMDVNGSKVSVVLTLVATNEQPMYVDIPSDFAGRSAWSYSKADEYRSLTLYIDKETSALLYLQSVESEGSDEIIAESQVITFARQTEMPSYLPEPEWEELEYEAINYSDGNLVIFYFAKENDENVVYYFTKTTPETPEKSYTLSSLQDDDNGFTAQKEESYSWIYSSEDNMIYMVYGGEKATSMEIKGYDEATEVGIVDLLLY